MIASTQPAGFVNSSWA